LEGMVFRSGGKEHTARGIRSNEGMFECSELQRTVQDCLNELPAEFRLILIMRELQGLTYGEIAVVLDILPNAPSGRRQSSHLFKYRTGYGAVFFLFCK